MKSAFNTFHGKNGLRENVLGRVGHIAIPTSPPMANGLLASVEGSWAIDAFCRHPFWCVTLAGSATHPCSLYSNNTETGIVAAS